jgi:hypothetical protein
LIYGQSVPRNHSAVLLGIVFVACACASRVSRRDSVDLVATDFVRLSLAESMVDSDLVRNIEAPPELAAGARAMKLTESQVRDSLVAIEFRARALPAPDAGIEAERLRRLRALIASLKSQIELKSRGKIGIPEEVRLRFGFEPRFLPLSAFDSTLNALDARLHGDGDVSDKVDWLRSTSIVPKDRIKPLFEASLAECKRRSAQHLPFPSHESTQVEYLEEAIAPGENLYQGNGRSVTRIGLGKPMELDRILALACHEVYPGHHLNFATLSEELYKKRNWVEFSVDYEVSPTLPVAEAVAEYGVGLVFPPEDRVRFEQDVLYPLAGMKMVRPDEWRAYFEARSGMLGATSTVAREYLEGRLDRAAALTQFRRYRLQSRNATEQLLPMLDFVGSYVIASDLGWTTIDRKLRSKPVDEQWKLFNRILREPMLLEDIDKL